MSKYTNREYHKSDAFILFMEENGFITHRTLLRDREPFYYNQETDSSEETDFSKSKFDIHFSKKYPNPNPFKANTSIRNYILPIEFNFSDKNIYLRPGINLQYTCRKSNLEKDIKIVETLIPLCINIFNISIVIFSAKKYHPTFTIKSENKEIKVLYDTRSFSKFEKDIFIFKAKEDDLENSKFYMNKREYSLMDLSKFYEDYLK